MTNGVLDVVLLYVKPSDLCSFFISNNLDMHMSFKYSAFGDLLRVREVKKMMCRFPNMILLGLSITYDNEKTKNFNDVLMCKLHKLVNLEIVGIDHELCFNSLGKYTHFDSLIFTKCVNVKNVIIKNMKICLQIHINIVLCKNIKSIRFTNCKWTTSIHFIASLPRLRAVKFTTEKIIESEIITLQECSKLRMLEIVNRLEHFLKCSLPITHLKINSSLSRYTSPIYLSEFNMFTKLKFLDLSNCRSKIYIDKVSYRLRGLNVMGCEVVIYKNENVLKGLKYFRTDNNFVCCDVILNNI